MKIDRVTILTEAEIEQLEAEQRVAEVIKFLDNVDDIMRKYFEHSEYSETDQQIIAENMEFMRE